MATHPENMTSVGRLLRQNIAIKQECFILAESITRKALERLGEVNEVVRDAYLANIPNVAAHIAQSMSNLANMSLNVHPKEFDRVYDEAEMVLKEVKAVNKEREGGQK